MDIDGNGTLDQVEMLRAVRMTGMGHVTADEVAQLIEHFDDVSRAQFDHGVSAPKYQLIPLRDLFHCLSAG